jgi:hypothetical protein
MRVVSVVPALCLLLALSACGAAPSVQPSWQIGIPLQLTGNDCSTSDFYTNLRAELLIGGITEPMSLTIDVAKKTASGKATSITGDYVRYIGVTWYYESAANKRYDLMYQISYVDLTKGVIGDQEKVDVVLDAANSATTRIFLRPADMLALASLPTSPSGSLDRAQEWLSIRIGGASPPDTTKLAKSLDDDQDKCANVFEACAGRLGATDDSCKGGTACTDPTPIVCN